MDPNTDLIFPGKASAAIAHISAAAENNPPPHIKIIDDSHTS